MALETPYRKWQYDGVQEYNGAWPPICSFRLYQGGFGRWWTVGSINRGNIRGKVKRVLPFLSLFSVKSVDSYTCETKINLFDLISLVII